MRGGDWVGRLTESLRLHETDRASPRSRYEILGEIARGGMGVVYRARDVQLDRIVALKVVDDDAGGGPELLDRFQREIRFSAALEHPHIVPVYDGGSLDGKPCLAMKFVDGTSIDRAGLGSRDALAGIRDAARAVHHAHRQGIVHRDLKPTNLLRDAAGHVYVADFGLARRIGSAVGLTLPGTVVGTPAYMAPEQARGVEADARSDVYSLGATLYELLTGRPPYAGERPGEILEALRAGPPAAPCRLRPELSRNAEAIILQAMEREPWERYATAESLAVDIDLYLSGQRPRARRRGRFHSLSRFLRRHPWRSAGMAVSGLLLALVLAAAGLLGAAWSGLSRAKAEADLDARLRILGGWIVRLLPEARDLAQQTLAQHLDRLVGDVRHAWSAGRLPDAQERIGHVRIHDPRRADELQKEHDRVLQDRRLEDAIRDFQAALREQNFPEARRQLAVIQAGDPGRAAELQLESAERLLEREALDRAFQEALHRAPIEPLRPLFRRAVEQHPDLAEAWRPRMLDRELEELARHAESGDAAAFDALLGILEDPAWTAVFPALRRLRADQLQGLARSLAGRGEFAKAVDALDRAEALGFADAALFRDRFRYRAARRDWPGAAKDFAAYAARNADGADREESAAPLLRWQAAQAEAREDWPELLSLQAALFRHEEGADDLLLHAEARLKTGSPALEWLDILNRALLRSPAREPRAWLVDAATAHAEAQLRSQPFEGREERWKAALRRVEPLLLRLERKPPSLLSAWARLKRRLGEGDAALPLLERLEGTSLLRGQILMARADLDPGLLRKAADLFRAALDEPGERSRALFWRGHVERRLQSPGASPILAEARRAGASGPVLAIALARIRLNEKDADAALLLCEEALRPLPALGDDDWLAAEGERRGEDPAVTAKALILDLRVLKAEAHLIRKEHEACIVEATRAIDAGIPGTQPFLLRGLARLPGLKRGSPPAAVEDLSAHLRAHPQDLQARMALAAAHERMDSYEEAERELDRVIARKADGPDAYYARGLVRSALGHAVGARSDFEKARELCPPGSPLLPKILAELKPR